MVALGVVRCLCVMFSHVLHDPNSNALLANKLHVHCGPPFVVQICVDFDGHGDLFPKIHC